MPLAPGAKIGGYEIVALVGAGGMGEVYRARDRRLGRDVAIKILSPAIAADGDGLMRFEREARVLASLNHPNIAAIYGVDDDAGFPALILEFVDGETLADRIARGRIPVAEALEYAKQIADALDIAHEAGIVHRDLKPGNIKIAGDGRVKVLDFGLAKAIAAATSPDEAIDTADAPTVTVHGTKGGVILGTAAYMSPEQARGKRIDKRTDIWAFGCVLYEMLTGMRAFNGETTSDVIASIIERHPDLAKLPPSVPSYVRRILERCLAKDPKRRARDIADVRADFDPAPPVEPAPNQRARERWIGLAVGVLAVAAFVGWPRLRDSPPADPFSETTAIPLQIDAQEIAISPDGRAFAFVANRDGMTDIWVRQIAGGAPLRVTNDVSLERWPVFAPDGDSLYFSRVDETGSSIWRVAVLGGEERKLISNGARVAPSADGRSLAYLRGQGILAISSSDGTAARDVARSVAAASAPAWSRDGRFVSFVRGGLFAPVNLFVVDIRSGEERQVTQFRQAPERINEHAWLPDDRHIVATYSTSRDLASARLDLGVVDVRDGSMTRVTMAIADGFLMPRLSADGSRLIVGASRFDRDIWKVPLGPDPDANGRAASVLHAGGDPMWTSTSRDGKTALFAGTLGGARNLWILPLNGVSSPRQVTTIRDGAVMHSLLSPDASRVVFASSVNGQADLWLQNVDGSNLRQLTNDRDADSWPVWSPDGSRIIYSATSSGPAETRIIAAGGGVPDKLIDGFFRGDWVMQPNGTGSWIVTSNGTDRIRLIDVERRQVLWEELVPGTDLSLPMFGPDGRSISIPAQDGSDRSVIWVIDAITRERRVAARLPFAVFFRADWIDDGRALLVNRVRRATNLVLFDQFWKASP